MTLDDDAMIEDRGPVKGESNDLDVLPVHAGHSVLTEAAPQIRTVRVPGACHLIPLQHPEAVVDAVRSVAPGD